MYEKFTDRARKLMQIANQEAQRFNHECVGTEHILLGIARMWDGEAAVLLTALGVEPRRIKLEVEKIVQRGPEMVTMGKLPQTPRVKKVIEYAMEEALGLNHNYVGTGHILLGLLRAQEGVAEHVLLGFGISFGNVKNQFASSSSSKEVVCSHLEGGEKPSIKQVVPPIAFQANVENRNNLRPPLSKILAEVNEWCARYEGWDGNRTAPVPIWVMRRALEYLREMQKNEPTPTP